MKNGLSAVLAAGVTLLLGSTADAHVEVEGGTGSAGATQVVTFSIGHGCKGFDTYGLDITIPDGVTSVRPVFSAAFGKPTVKVNDATKAVTGVSWRKADSDITATDVNFYELQIRMALPNAPFTKILLPATQLCRDPATGTEYKTDWVAAVASTDENGPEPAPSIYLLPPHSAGWNKFTVTSAIDEKGLSVFNDAQIVWAGNAAYSSNATTKDQISKEPNTTVLTAIPANTEIWVKY